jgi:hypothetical protein
MGSGLTAARRPGMTLKKDQSSLASVGGTWIIAATIAGL